MPIGFLATSNSATAVATDPDERRLLDFLTQIVADQAEDLAFSVALEVDVQLKRVTAGTPASDGAPKVLLTNDPNAPKVYMAEEDVRKTFAWTYEDLRKQLKKRYSDFKATKMFHALKKSLMSDKRYVHCRYLDPKNPKSGSKDFYNPNIMAEFDKHFTPKAAPAAPTKQPDSAPAAAEVSR